MKSTTTTTDTLRDSHELVADLFRHESGRLIALLTRRVGAARLDTVEDAVQDALVAAMRNWPLHGVPRNPSGWLFTVSRNALTDRLRRARFESPRGFELEIVQEDDKSFSREAALDDDLLNLIAYCCHPALTQSAQLALTLRLACGLNVQEIAGALLTSPDSIAQRIVRAKRELRDLGIRFDLPATDELMEQRLPGILHSIYLLFDAGYLSAHHEQWLRPMLCSDALRLSRLLTAHPATDCPATHALAALLHLTAARMPARVTAEGRPIPLSQQNRTLWDRALIAAGFGHFDAAIAGDTLTRYHIEAAIAATHARASSVATTHWEQILSHYDQLCALYPSPVASLNRIIALRHVHGPQAALQRFSATDELDPLQDSLVYYATLGELHDALGEHDKAADAFMSAAALSGSIELGELFRSRELRARNPVM